VLLKTRNSSLWDRPSFARDYVSLSLDGARSLIERGVKLIGIDYLSVEGFGVEGHRGPRLPQGHTRHLRALLLAAPHRRR